MTHCVVIPNKIAAKDVDAYVRPAISGSALDNGNVFRLDAKSATAGEGEVWTTSAPVSGSLSGLWMALEPEMPLLVNGTKQYNGLGTVQDFYTPAGVVFTAVKLVPGDIITLTAEALDSGTAAAYALPVADTYKLAWSASGGNCMMLKYLNTTYIPSASGAIASGRITAFQFEVAAN